MIGVAIGGLSILLIVAFLISTRVKWNRRWTRELQGVPIRVLCPLSDALGIDLANGINSVSAHMIAHKIRASWAVEVVALGDVTTESVPTGKLPDGQPVGGSVREEKCFPWSSPMYVAVVVNQRTSAFLIHEMTRHVYSSVLYGEPDEGHLRKDLAGYERDVKGLLHG